MDTEKPFLDKMNAFYIFKTEGIDRVRDLYPDLVTFCQDHKKEEYLDLKNALVREMSATK